MFAKASAGPRAPENISIGFPRSRVVATSISTRLPPEPFALIGTSTPGGVAHAAKHKTTARIKGILVT